MKRMRIRKASDVPTNFKEHLLILWEEDDAPVPDKEGTSQAFRRIAGSDRHIRVWSVDEGDAIYNFYRGGWVKIYSPEGGAIGLLVENADSSPIEPVEPVAYLHILDNTDGIEGNEPIKALSFSPKCPFGVRGKDFDESYEVSSITLFG